LAGCCLWLTGTLSNAIAQVLVAPLPTAPLLARGTVYATAVQADGRMLIAGNFHFVNGGRRAYLARLNTDGTLDETWNPSPDGVVRALLVSGDYVYAGGEFTVMGGQSRLRIARLNLTGTGAADPVWVANANGVVHALTSDGGGIYAGGDFTTVNGQSRNRLAKLGNYGVVDPGWNPGANGGVRALLLDGTELYVGGAFTILGGTTRNRLGRVTSTGAGAVDGTWDPNANNTVHTLASSGSYLCVGGDFTSIASQTRYYLARIPKIGGGAPDPWSPNPNIYVRALAVSGDDLFVGGAFTSVGGQFRNRAAKILATGAVDSSWNPNAGDTVQAILPSSGAIYLGGDFASLGAVSALGVARVDAVSGAKDPTFGADVHRRGEVRAIALQSDGKTVVGGDFIAVGADERRHLARFNTDGSLDAGWVPAANAPVNAIAISETASQTNIYVGGEFTMVNGASVNYLANLNPDGSVAAWYPNPDYFVRALAVSGADLYAGGEFTVIGTLGRNRIAKVSATGSVDPAWDPNANGAVNTLLADGSAVYVGGTFTMVGSATRNRIAKLSPAGAGMADAGWDANANGTVNALAASGTGLVVGGNFTSIGGTSRNRIAKLTGGGTADPDWNPNASAAVHALAVHDTNVYAGGDFTVIGGVSRARIVRLSATGSGAVAPGWRADADGQVRAVVTSTEDLCVGGRFGGIQGEARDGLALLLREHLPGEEVVRPPAAKVEAAFPGPVMDPPGMLCWHPLSQRLYAVTSLGNGVTRVTWTNWLDVPFTLQVAVRGSELSEHLLGEAIPPPASIDVHTLPDNGPTVDPSWAAVWHLPTRRLYATTNGQFTVAWGLACPIVTTAHRGHWPTDPARYQLHVAGSPPVNLELGPVSPSARLLLQDSGVGTEPDLVNSEHKFTAAGPGRSLLLLAPGNPTETNLYFQFVQTVRWDDPVYLHDHAAATIGQELTGFLGYHDGQYGQPFVFHPWARYCALEGYYDRTTRTGPIIPVNRDRLDTVTDDLVLVCYQPATHLLDPQTGQGVTNPAVGWPHKAVRYDCQWPDPAPGTIVIASQSGTGPVPLTDWDLYVQSELSAPGYNPNEEHAFVLPAAGRPPELRLNPTEIRVLEGGVTAIELQIVAESAPETNVTLSISSARDGDATVTGSFSTNVVAITDRTLELADSRAPQTIYFRAASDADSLDGTNRFVVRAMGGFVDQKAIVVRVMDTNRLSLVVDAVAVLVPETSRRSFTIRLTRRPPADVHVLMSRQAGSDSDLALEGNGRVIFPAASWDTPQSVNIVAGTDVDSADGEAYFRLDASGGLTQSVLLKAGEIDNSPPARAVFALRDDLGDLPGASTPQFSEPYVLLTHGAPAQRQIKVYRVVAEEGLTRFVYPGTAGRLIQPPYPLSVLPDWEVNSSYVRGPAWEDRKGFFWAKAAGDDGGLTNIVMHFFYPVLNTNFFFAEGYRELGALVPWLDHRPGGVQGTPTDVTYEIAWPVDTPELRVGESLLKAKFGLPNIRGQASVDVLYEQAAAGGLGSGSSVQVIDPTFTYQTPLVVLPGDFAGKTGTNLLNGNVYFTPLPPHLRKRVWFDPTATRLKFSGEFVEESGTEEPVGYLLLNVLTPQDRADLLSLSQDPGYASSVQDLANQASGVKLVGPNQTADSLALTAGNARGTGYVTLVFNNAVRTGLPADRGSPVSLEVIRVGAPKYRGEVRIIESEDPFDERLTMRHTGDFAGNSPQYEFHWEYHGGPERPAGDSPGWHALDTGIGMDQTVIGGPGLRTLSDYWYRCRWRATNPSFPLGTEYDPNGLDWTEATLAEGWIKRVLGGISFFDQRYDDLVNSPVDTIVNVISQSGGRYLGAVPLDQQAAAKFGLIEIYESVLKRGIELSIEGNPPVMDPGASRALLLVANRLAQIYLLLGNEAYADAANPTVGFVTTGAQYGVEATSVHCFMDQVSSLLEEELALLRGLDDDAGRRDVFFHPVYNRLPWNMFTGAEAEPAYKLNYDVRDTNEPNEDGYGTIDARDAAKIWPQGHGDAWGHYLTALKNFYRLARNPNFLWTVTSESVHLQTGGDISVNYQYERRFAQTAAAKAQTGAEIVNLAYRSRYVEDPNGQWQGYMDSQTNRTWGLSEWASRAGQGAFFDWAFANALLPPPASEPADYRVDRETVAELREIVAGFVNIQEQLDRADAGLNPLGVAKNVVPFDIDPQKINAGQTHFEQIYERATKTMNNAIGVFNHANASTQKLREQADSLQEFQRAVDDREADFRSRLVEVFGYPYPDDPAYPDQYAGPDLFHYMYNEYSDITGEPTPGPHTFTVNVRDYVVAEDGRLTVQSQPVAYHVGPNAFGLVKPPEWMAPRRAPGEIQMAHSDLLQATARFRRGMAEYENLIAQIEDQATLLQAQYGLNAEEVRVLNLGQASQESLNAGIRRARVRGMNLQLAARVATMTANAISEAMPKVFGIIAGLAGGTTMDPGSFGLRQAALIAGNVASEALTSAASWQSMVELDHQQAKELAQSQQNIVLTTLRQEQAILGQIAQLEQLVRQEILLRLELYNLREAMQQATGRYSAALARGQRLLEDRLRFRQQTAEQVQNYRYKDMAFRIFRNEALQKYRAQFDLAAMYVYLAAAAYDYETNLRPEDRRIPGQTFMTDIVRARSLGVITSSGDPLPGPGAGRKGDGGLAAALYHMKFQWDNFIKTQLGFNNPDQQQYEFSLRSGWFRIQPGAAGNVNWREALKASLVPNMLEFPEFKRYCKEPLTGLLPVEPSLVIPFSTSVHFGHNLFGWPETGGGGNFNPTHFATKINAVGVRFINYDSAAQVGLSPTPYVYFLPVGNDVLRSPVPQNYSGAVPIREWKILDQILPAPLAITDLSSTFGQSTWIPINEMEMDEQFAALRRYAQMPAYHDGNPNPVDLDGYRRLIGRSVWNTRWLLIIPAGSLLNDRNEALERFINGRLVGGQRNLQGVSDIKVFFKVYSVPGL
jgi:hypothetical protein